MLWFWGSVISLFHSHGVSRHCLFLDCCWEIVWDTEDMVFIIFRVTKGTDVIENWFGCNYTDTTSLLDLRNSFSLGNLDKQPKCDESLNSQITVEFENSKTNFTQYDHSSSLSNIVSLLLFTIIVSFNLFFSLCMRHSLSIVVKFVAAFSIYFSDFGIQIQFVNL